MISIDKILRNKFLISLIGFFRTRFPTAYLKLRKIYTQFFLENHEKLEPFQIRALQRIKELVPTPTKEDNILEIGSDEHGHVLSYLHDKYSSRVIGINPSFKESYSKNKSNLPFTMLAEDIRKTNFKDESFDLIFSVAVFEHINDFEKALAEIYRLTKKGGYVYAFFGPIWSSSLGHHVKARFGNDEARHWDPTRNPIPDYAHLLNNPEELKKLIKNQVSDGLMEEIINWIYCSKDINRVHYEDYIKVFNSSKFKVENLDFDYDFIASDTLKLLKERYGPKYSVFDIKNMEVVLKK